MPALLDATAERRNQPACAGQPPGAERLVAEHGRVQQREIGAGACGSAHIPARALLMGGGLPVVARGGEVVFGERQVVQRMCPLARSSLSLLGQACQSILAHRFQQDKSWLLTLLIGLVQQAVIEQRANSTQRVTSRVSPTATDLLDCFEGAAANKDSKMPEEPSLSR